jgi:phage terminase large subunit-like protein
MTASEYIDKVLTGKIVTGKYARLAVERHVNDLIELPKQGYYFDEDAANLVIDFYRFIKHTKGPMGGQIFELSGWQKFITSIIFGWKRADGNRRFKEAYIKVARKNGKSTWLTPLCLYKQFAEFEYAAEVYSAATSINQASIIFREGKRMVNASRELSKYLKVNNLVITHQKSDSIFRALASDSDKLDGLNVSLAAIDEYHAHKTDEMYDVLKSSMGARDNNLLIVITTAGFSSPDNPSPCYLYEQDCKAILDGIVKAENRFAIIYEIDDEDRKLDENGEFNWKNPNCWIKANPNLNISVKLSQMQDDCDEAIRLTRKRRNFLTKHLNVWVDAPDTWILPEVWAKNYKKITDDELKGAMCYGGLDLASTKDFTAFALYFPETHTIKLFTFIPEETVQERIGNGLADLERWIEKGWVIVTPGNVTDYDFVKKKVYECADLYDLQSIAYDPWNATQTAIDIEEAGITMSPFAQNIATINTPTKEFERLTLEGKLNHENNAVLAWMISKVVIYEDANSNIKVHKGRSNKGNNKVDGVVASIIALGEYMTNNANQGSSGIHI